jgi:hypothetical protein
VDGLADACNLARFVTCKGYDRSWWTSDPTEVGQSVHIPIERITLSRPSYDDLWRR